MKASLVTTLWLAWTSRASAILSCNSGAVRLKLVRVSNQQDILTLARDSVMDLATTPRHTVVADLTKDYGPDTVVVLEHNDVWIRNETLPPYYITAVTNKGKPMPFRLWTPGYHTLTASVIASDGELLACRTMGLRVVNTNFPTNIALSLINAKSREDLGPLPNEIDIQDVGSRLTVHATTDQPVDAITFYFDDNGYSRVDEKAPYALGERKFRRFGPLADPGSHTIRAVALWDDTPVGSVQMELEVVDDRSVPTTEPSLTPTISTSEPTTPPSPSDPYDLTLDLVGVPGPDESFFIEAAKRWESIITEGLPGTSNTGNYAPTEILGCEYPGVIDDLYVCGGYGYIDGAFGTLGYAGPTYVYSDSGLAIAGVMKFETVDAARFNDQMAAIIMHEMGHVLGIGTLWTRTGVAGPDSDDCPYYGTNANAEYEAISGCGVVPTELDGGPGTRCGHWDELCLRNELLTGYIDTGFMPLSKISIGSLDDLGYNVDYTKADPFDSSHLGVCPPCDNSRNLSAIKKPHGQAEFLGPNKFPTRKLSDDARQHAIDLGLSILQANSKLVPAPSRPQISVPGSRGVEYVGDKVLSVLVVDRGNIFSVIVKRQA